MKKLLLLIFILSSTNAFCQDGVETDKLPLEGQNNFSVTVSPSAFINVYPGIQIGVSKKIANRVFLDLESAYLYKVYRQPESYTDGFRMKLGVKIPLRSEEIFLLTNFFYRKTFHNQEDTFLRFDGLYSEDIFYQKTKTLLGPAIGWAYHFESKKVSFEIGSSYGIGTLKVESYDLPADAELSRVPIFSFFNNDGNYGYLIISFQFKVKFKIL